MTKTPQCLVTLFVYESSTPNTPRKRHFIVDAPDGMTAWEIGDRICERRFSGPEYVGAVTQAVADFEYWEEAGNAEVD